MGKSGIREIADSVRDVPEFVGNPEGDLEAIEEYKAREYRIRHLDGVADRLGHLRNADDILHEFSSDAARLLVAEMFTGSKAERLKAIQQVLDRTMGRPVERTITMNVKEMKDGELDNKIKDLMYGLGYIKDGERGSTSLLIKAEGIAGEGEVNNPPDVALAGEVPPEPEKD